MKPLRTAVNGFQFPFKSGVGSLTDAFTGALVPGRVDCVSAGGLCGGTPATCMARNGRLTISNIDLQVESVCACNPAHGLHLFGAIQCNNSPDKRH